MSKPLPKWEMWKHVPTLTATEAVALTLGVDPQKAYEWSKNKWVYNVNKSGCCCSIEGFADRLFLFKKCFGVYGKISPSQLTVWAKSVGWNMPNELEELATNEVEEKRPDAPAPTANASAAKGEAAQGTNPNGDDAEKQDTDDHDDTLAALFDPVPVDVLEKMFPADGKWKSWTDRAARKGLIHAREGTAMYNPYKAGMWFVSNGRKGLTIGHCRRMLANNHLPDRSLDKKYLLTCELD